MTELVICDCDNTMGIPGLPIDDGQTLLYLWGRSDIDLLGITTTFGNGTIEEVLRATKDILSHVGKQDLPLIQGAERRGDIPGAAAAYLAETAAANPGEVSILAIGPLGNLHAASLRDPDFFRNVKQIVIMGGSTAPIYLGDDELPELNLACDPEAAYAVLTAPCEITLMNAQICLEAPFSLDDMPRIKYWDDRTKKMVQDFLEHLGQKHGEAKDYLWDVLPAVYLSHPEVFESNDILLSSTVDNLITGMIYEAQIGDLPRINMPNKILDIDRFDQIVDEAWADCPVSNRYETMDDV